MRNCEKGYRNKPLTDEQKLSNRAKSKVRVRGGWGTRIWFYGADDAGFAFALYWTYQSNL